MARSHGGTPTNESNPTIRERPCRPQTTGRSSQVIGFAAKALAGGGVPALRPIKAGEETIVVKLPKS